MGWVWPEWEIVHSIHQGPQALPACMSISPPCQTSPLPLQPNQVQPDSEAA